MVRYSDAQFHSTRYLNGGLNTALLIKWWSEGYGENVLKSRSETFSKTLWSKTSFCLYKYPYKTSFYLWNEVLETSWYTLYHENVE